MNSTSAFASNTHIDDLIKQTKDILNEKLMVQDKIREFKI